jgi:serine/threonine protein kinase
MCPPFVRIPRPIALPSTDPCHFASFLPGGGTCKEKMAAAAPPPAPVASTHHPIIKTLRLFPDGHRIVDEKAQVEYVVQRLIERGGSCFCYHAQTAENQVDVAVKVFSMAALMDQREASCAAAAVAQKQPPSHLKAVEPLPLTFDVARESQLLSSLEHPNILRAYRFFNDRSHAYFVLELCEKLNMHRLLATMQMRRQEAASKTASGAGGGGGPPGGFNEERVRGYMLQLGQAVKYLHDRGIVHRDLKLGNCFFRDSTFADVRLGDFGLAVKLDEMTPKGYVTEPAGTPVYVAPEVIAPRAFPRGDGAVGYERPADVWSLGVCMFIMLFGMCPWNDSPERPVAQKIVADPLVFPEKLRDGVSESSRDLLTQMLRKRPADRPTIRQVLAHAWFRA